MRYLTLAFLLSGCASTASYTLRQKSDIGLYVCGQLESPNLDCVSYERFLEEVTKQQKESGKNVL